MILYPMGNRLSNDFAEKSKISAGKFPFFAAERGAPLCTEEKNMQKFLFKYLQMLKIEL